MEETRKIESEFFSTLTQDFEVNREELQETRRRSRGIENQNSIAELEDDINPRNFDRTDYFYNVVHAYINNKDNTRAAIMSTTADTHKLLCKNKYKIHM